MYTKLQITKLFSECLWRSVYCRLLQIVICYLSLNIYRVEKCFHIEVANVTGTGMYIVFHVFCAIRSVQKKIKFDFV
jgi:hypothetical protein